MTLIGRPPVPLAERFAARVMPEPNSGCWLWTGHIAPNGYGQIKISPRADRATGVHRVSWLLHRGPIPDGMCVCHRCDVRCCVNPAHLFLGSYADNMQDAAAKGRMNWKPGAPKRALPRGGSHHQAKLTETDVRAIRAAPEDGPTMAARYGVSAVNISRIRRRVIWKHVA